VKHIYFTSWKYVTDNYSVLSTDSEVRLIKVAKVKLSDRPNRLSWSRSVWNIVVKVRSIKKMQDCQIIPKKNFHGQDLSRI
jgi:hypothetical protein